MTFLPVSEALGSQGGVQETHQSRTKIVHGSASIHDSNAFTVKCRQLRCSSGVDDDGHAVDTDERLCREWCQNGVNQMYRERILTLEGLAAADRVLVARHTAEDGDGRAARADRDVQRRDVDAEEALEGALGPRVDVARVFDVLAALRTGSGRRARRRGRRRRPGPLGVDDDGHAVDADERV
jgi:hypothetical protein